MTTVGVLAIQGDYREHRTLLESLGADVKEIRLPDQLDEVDGLIIPGGESTTIVQLIDIYNMREKLRERVLNEGMPTWGTCAGMILLAERVVDGAEGQETLGGIDMTVRRNAFGRQVASFEGTVTMAGLDKPVHGVFIRAPWVEEVGPGVEVLARVDHGEAAGRIVAVREGHLMATSFHPEVGGDSRVHQLLVDLVRPRSRAE